MELNLEADTISVLEAFPESFSFYSHGTVKESEEAGVALELGPDTRALAFRYSGDFSGVILTLFDPLIDPNAYLEMGNILASRFADRLASRADGVGVMISPPSSLSSNQLSRFLLAAGSRLLRKDYLHVLNNGENGNLPIQMLVIPDQNKPEALDA